MRARVGAGGQSRSWSPGQGSGCGVLVSRAAEEAPSRQEMDRPSMRMPEPGAGVGA